VGIADVTTESVTPDGARTAVVLRVGGTRFRVLVEIGESPVPQMLTCRAVEATCAPTRRVTHLTEL
jgi:hypothetical protein